MNMAEPGKNVVISGAPKTKRWPYVVGAFILLAILGNCSKIGKNQPTGLTTADALHLCKQAIRGSVRDPDRAVIPEVPDFGDANEYHFAWNPKTKVLRLRNGLGLEVANTGSCTVQKIGRHVSSLTIEGQRIR